MFDSILVPTDGSGCARLAVDYAADLASQFGSEVHVLNVVDPRRLENAPHYEEVKVEATELTTKTCDRLADADIAVESAVRAELPSVAILEYVDENSIDLVVMGTHGRTGVERYLLGSVAEKVVRYSDVPVLTVRPSDDGAATYPYTDVLVPTDGSAGAEAAIDPAIAIVGSYGARLHALSVVDTRSLGIDVRSSVVLEDLEEVARAAVEQVADRASSESVSDTETVVDYGLPYECIRSYVAENDVDLVIMGTQGQSGLPRYLLGSVTEKLVRTSPAPVLTVPQQRTETK